ncbi:hypothetical protein D3C75_1174720 [compost metagenome]
MDGDTRGHLMHLGQQLLEVFTKIRFAQDHHGICPAFPRQNQVTLQPAEIKVLV